MNEHLSPQKTTQDTTISQERRRRSVSLSKPEHKTYKALVDKLGTYQDAAAHIGIRRQAASHIYHHGTCAQATYHKLRHTIPGFAATTPPTPATA